MYKQPRIPLFMWLIFFLGIYGFLNIVTKDISEHCILPTNYTIISNGSLYRVVDPQGRSSIDLLSSREATAMANKLYRYRIKLQNTNEWKLVKGSVK